MFFCTAKTAVALARFLRAWRRQHMRNAAKMNAQPSVIRRISHQDSERPDEEPEVGDVGLLSPVMVGRGGSVLEACGTATRSERQIPRPGTTLVELPQVAVAHEPPRSVCEELEQDRQLLGPAPEQLEQLASQDWQDDEVLSKNWDWLQVGKQRPLVKTGRSGGQLEHWVKEEPEHDAQSG